MTRQHRQQKNKARSYVDVTGNLYSTVPSGWTPVVTVEGWVSVLTESGKPVTAKRNQLTIIEEIATTTTSEQGPLSGSSRSGWGWVTEGSTYTIDIPTQSSSTAHTTTTSKSATTGSVTIPYSISLEPMIPPWWSESYKNTLTKNVAITESSQVTTTLDTTLISTTSSTSSTSSSTILPSATASVAPESSSPSTGEWVGIIVGSVCMLVLVIIFILSFYFRSRPKAPTRENSNNINIRLDNVQSRNRPLAETNLGAIPEGWDDIRL
ncbi:hypothetical protein FVEN_g13158 [Fusarium venenatum]|uniref:uncharacterized protein n=1 Tax=Fusarium venenatum TaxID=56646 RepID=UPI001D262AC0|nr:hypothetical protein FVEN_g13158 [Fusarium venenatum]KAH6992042.1 hypothetical protein EDB82DRAFT_473864 [Fusarium venenatum]